MRISRVWRVNGEWFGVVCCGVVCTVVGRDCWVVRNRGPNVRVHGDCALLMCRDCRVLRNQGQNVRERGCVIRVRVGAGVANEN